MEGEEFVTFTATSQQVATETFWFPFGRPSLYFYSQCSRSTSWFRPVFSLTFLWIASHLISCHFVASRVLIFLLSRPVSSQRRYREDRLFHRQQHRLPAAQRDGAGGHPGDGVSASTRQVGHGSPLCESRTWSGV